MGYKYKYELTPEEREWLDQASDAQERDDMETFRELSKKVPLTPSVAWAAKRVLGAEHLRREGYNLKWANMEFGDGWLDR